MPSQRVLPRSFWRCDCQQSGLVPSRVNRELVTDPGLFHPVRGPMTAFRAMAKIVQPQFDIAAEFARRDDVVVLASSLALGARIARDKLRRRVAGEPGTGATVMPRKAAATQIRVTSHARTTPPGNAWAKLMARVGEEFPLECP